MGAGDAICYKATILLGLHMCTTLDTNKNLNQHTLGPSKLLDMDIKFDTMYKVVAQW